MLDAFVSVSQRTFCIIGSIIEKLGLHAMLIFSCVWHHCRALNFLVTL